MKKQKDNSRIKKLKKIHSILMIILIILILVTIFLLSNGNYKLGIIGLIFSVITFSILNYLERIIK